MDEVVGRIEILEYLGDFKPVFIGTPEEVHGLEARDVVVSMTFGVGTIVVAL